MLYVYFGNNTSEVRQKALARVHVCAGNDGQVVHITSDTYMVGSLIDLARGASLFSEKQVLFGCEDSKEVEKIAKKARKIKDRTEIKEIEQESRSY